MSLWALYSGRKNKVAHGFPVKPVWAEGVVAGLITVGILGFTLILNSYEIPERVLARDFAAQGLEVPEGYSAAYGLPISVLLLIANVLIITSYNRFIERKYAQAFK